MGAMTTGHIKIQLNGTSSHFTRPTNNFLLPSSPLCMKITLECLSNLHLHSCKVDKINMSNQTSGGNVGIQIPAVITCSTNAISLDMALHYMT